MNDMLGRSQRFLTDDELLSEHNNIKNVAMNHFTENPTIGRIKDISKPFENNLCQVKFLSKPVLVNWLESFVGTGLNVPRVCEPEQWMDDWYC